MPFDVRKVHFVENKQVRLDRIPHGPQEEREYFRDAPNAATCGYGRLKYVHVAE